MSKKKDIQFIRNFTMTAFFYISKSIGNGNKITKNHRELFNLCLAEISFLDWGVYNSFLKIFLFPFAYLRSILLIMYDLTVNEYDDQKFDSVFLEISSQLEDYSFKYVRAKDNSNTISNSKVVIEEADSEIFLQIQSLVYGVLKELSQLMRKLA